MRYIIDRKTNEHERYDGQNYDATKYRIVQADSEGWIAHTGKECPLPDDVRFEYRMADGEISEQQGCAGVLRWTYTCSDADITHYRPILTKPEPQTIGDLIRRDHPYKDRKQAEKVQEPEPAAELTTNTIDLLGTLARAHEHAAQIPDLEAELREVLAGMGYDLVARSPFVEPEPAVETTQDKVIAGALFDFLGFLTTRDKPTSFGATRNASPAVELLQEWADKRGLDLKGADVENWHSRPAKGEPVAEPDMSDWRNWRAGDLVLDYSSPWPVVSITKIAKSEDNSSRPVQLSSPCGDLYSPDIKDLRFYSRPTQQRHGAGE